MEGLRHYNSYKCAYMSLTIAMLYYTYLSETSKDL